MVIKRPRNRCVKGFLTKVERRLTEALSYTVQLKGHLPVNQTSIFHRHGIKPHHIQITSDLKKHISALIITIGNKTKRWNSILIRWSILGNCPCWDGKGLQLNTKAASVSIRFYFFIEWQFFLPHSNRRKQ